jgi:hypothetical protein
LWAAFPIFVFRFGLSEIWFKYNSIGKGSFYCVVGMEGPKWVGVTGGWRKLHNEELHNLYSSPSIIRIMKSRRMRWAGHVARMREKRNAYRLLVGKPEGKGPLERPRRRWIETLRWTF